MIRKLNVWREGLEKKELRVNLSETKPRSPLLPASITTHNM